MFDLTSSNRKHNYEPTLYAPNVSTVGTKRSVWYGHHQHITLFLSYIAKLPPIHTPKTSRGTSSCQQLACPIVDGFTAPQSQCKLIMHTAQRKLWTRYMCDVVAAMTISPPPCSLLLLMQIEYLYYTYMRNRILGIGGGGGERNTHHPGN